MNQINPSRWSVILGAFCLLLISGSASGLVNGKKPVEENKRYDAVAAFSYTKWLIEDDKDKTVHNWFGNGVLIAPDVVLVAKHLLPDSVKQGKGQASNKLMVRFRRHPDGSLGSKKAGPDSYHQVPIYSWIVSSKTDLALGILSKPVEHIDPVRMLLDNDLQFTERRCLLAAWGSESRWRGKSGPRNALRVGENTATRNGGFLRVDSYEVEMREAPGGNEKLYVTDDSAVPNMHDSGGSMFLFDAEGQPLLAGIITTYSGGVFLAEASSDQFPLGAAAKGGRELLKVIKENRLKEPQ